MNRVPVSKKMYAASLVRVCLVVFAALVLPRFFFQGQSYRSGSIASPESSFRLGIENLSKEFLQSLNIQGRIDGYRVGIVTNHTGVDQQGKRSVDILLSHGLRIKKIYVPEDDLNHFNTGPEVTVDSVTKIPLFALTPLDRWAKKSNEYPFADIDVLFLDMQEPGLTPNSYIATMLNVLQSAANQNKTIVVLDRPNILGATMEGIVADAKSNGQEQIAVPLRSGMTIGELARYFNSALLSKSANLFVVPMSNYDRALFADAGTRGCGSLLTNIDAYYGTSFLTILAGVAPFDIGIGTEMAFHCLAVPESLHISKQKWFELRAILKEQGLESSLLHYIHPHKKIPYAGLRIFVPDIDNFSSFATILAIIKFFRDAGICLSYGPEFNRIFGTKKIRDFFEGKVARTELECEVNKRLKNFFTTAQPAFIYKPIPKMIFM